MKDQGDVKFAFDDKCLDECPHQQGARQVPGEMRCECPAGTHPVWTPNCQPDPTMGITCFEQCKCPHESHKDPAGGEECICDDPNLTMTYKGCVDSHTAAQDCDNRPNAAFFWEEHMCEEFMECPHEARYDGCRECHKRDHFSGHVETGCDKCHDEFHPRDYRHGATICVHDQAEYDCQGMPATATGGSTAAAFPQGPDHCHRCYMVGDEPICGECDHANGWELDWDTRTCFERLTASNEEWPEPCNADMEATCDICKAREEVDHNNAMIHV